MIILLLIYGFLCHPECAESRQKYLYQALLNWRDHFVKESSNAECLISVEGKLYQYQVIFEETESSSQILKCRTDSSSCMRWTFLKDAKVIEYQSDSGKVFR